MTFFLMKILTAAAAFFALGFLWYSDLMFGPEWRKLSAAPAAKGGKSRRKPARVAGSLPPWAAHVVTFLGIALACAVIAVLIVVNRIVGPGDGALFGFVLGLAFTATTMLSEAAYAHQPMGLFLINVSYRLTGFALAGALIAPWR